MENKDQSADQLRNKLDAIASMEVVMPTEEELYESSSRSYRRAAHTYLDNWPDELHSLSMPSKRIQVPDDLMSNLDILFEGEFDHPVLSRMADEMDTLMGWEQHFIRLNTRSPKDFTSPGLPITCSGKQALYWLGGSMRALDDLCMLKNARQPAYIYMRNHVAIYEPKEFRCFAKDGEFIGVTQYHYGTVFEELQDSKRRDKIFHALSAYYTDRIRPHFQTIVFDMVWRENLLLLEINPYGMSDPCCFKSYENVEKGGFAYEAA